jgi:hypothetical protein
LHYKSVYDGWVRFFECIFEVGTEDPLMCLNKQLFLASSIYRAKKKAEINKKNRKKRKKRQG